GHGPMRGQFARLALGRRLVSVEESGVAHAPAYQSTTLEKADVMRPIDHPHPGLALACGDLAMQLLHARPMHARAEMMLGVIAVVEPGGVVEAVVATDAP